MAVRYDTRRNDRKKKDLFIIIEGTDASGKSTLVREVQNIMCNSDPGVPVHAFHRSKPDELTRRWALDQYVLSIENQINQDSLGVADRWHWGEATYAQLKRPESGVDGLGLLGSAGWKWTEMFLMSRGACAFWLYQPLDVVKKRIAARGDDYVVADELEALIALYEEASAKSAIFAGKLQPNPDSLEEVYAMAESLVKTALDVEAEVQHLKGMPYYIGHPNPDALLIGDQKNMNRWYGSATNLPFIPVDGNSGDFLMGALPDDFWPTAGIINGNDHAAETLYEAWRTLGSPPVVALGRMAQRACERAEIDLAAVTSHPQHVKRFYASQQREYGEAIRALARGQETETRSDNWAKETSWVLA